MIGRKRQRRSKRKRFGESEREKERPIEWNRSRKWEDRDREEKTHTYTHTHTHTHIYIYITKHIDMKLDGSYTRMRRDVLKKSWRPHSTKSWLYGHLIPISKPSNKTNKTCWGLLRKQGRTHKQHSSMDPTYRRTNVGRLARTYLSSVRNLNVVWRTCLELYIIGTGGGRNRQSRKTMQSVQLDNNYIYIYIYIYIYVMVKI